MVNGKIQYEIVQIFIKNSMKSDFQEAISTATKHSTKYPRYSQKTVSDSIRNSPH